MASAAGSLMLLPAALPAFGEEATLVAPETAGIGTTIKVDWIGPGASGDIIQIWDPKGGPGGVVLVSTPVTMDETERQSVAMIVPALPGEFELRYYSPGEHAVLGARPLSVQLMEVLIEAPDEVETGAQIAAVWMGPGAHRDEIQIFDPNAADDGEVVDAQPVIEGDYAGRIVRLTAPADSGSYTLRYFNADSGIVLFERVLKVREAHLVGQTAD